jgi:hypothetical protein
MNIDQQIDRDHRLVILTLTGRLTDDELLGVAGLLEGNPAISKDFGFLIDLRHADGSGITSAGVRKMASRELALNASSRRAVVVPSGLGFGMAKGLHRLR